MVRVWRPGDERATGGRLHGTVERIGAGPPTPFRDADELLALLEPAGSHAEADSTP